MRMLQGYRRTPHQPEQGATEPHQVPEWIPPMLKKRWGLSLGGACFLFIASLEIFRYHVERIQGIPLTDKLSVSLARYLPTVGVIVLGFAWKAVAAEVKHIVPYSRMSGRWAKADDSVLVNYVNELEVVSVFKAARRRHWEVFFALATSLLCGLLVAFTNSLTYDDLFATATHHAPATQTTKFDLENSLVLPNGTLLMPWNYTGNKPYAAVAAQRLSKGTSAPWTSGKYAFDVFSPVETPSAENITISAEVEAVSVWVECQVVHYKPLAYRGTWDRYSMQADPDDVKTAGCSLPIEQERLFDHSPDTWLNVTACNSDSEDKRILATIINPTYDPYNTSRIIELHMAGLICLPFFTRQKARVSVDNKSGVVSSYEVLSESRKIEPPPPTEALWIYLNNPPSKDTRGAFGPKSDEYPAEVIANIGNVTKASRSIGVTGYFFSTLLDGQSDTLTRYINSSQAFRSEFQDLASDVLLQVVNFFARNNTLLAIKGTITEMAPRMLISNTMLQCAQCLLSLIGFASVSLTTYLRPRTKLVTNPGPIAATAVLLASSRFDVEVLMMEEASTSRDVLKKTLSGTEWILQSTPDKVDLELQVRKHGAANPHRVEDQSTCGIELEQQVVLHDGELVTSNQVKLSHKGWHPAALSVEAKTSLTAAICAAITVLACLLKVSYAYKGLCKESPAALLATSLVPTMLLVFVGYACSGIDAAVRSLSAYKSLSTKSKRNPLMFDIKEVPSFWDFFRSKGGRAGISLVAASFLVVLLPGMKLVAAGLYFVHLSKDLVPITISIDESLAIDLEHSFSTSDYSDIVQRAADFTEWKSIYQSEFPDRPGIIENFVLGNVTKIESSADNDALTGSTLKARVTAIEVEVICSAIHAQEFNISINTTPGSYSFFWYCGTEKCFRLFNLTSNEEVTSTTVKFSADPPHAYIGLSELSDKFSEEARIQPHENLVDSVSTPYLAILKDLSSMTTAAFTNQTPITTLTNPMLDSHGLWITEPDRINLTLPRTIAVACTRDLHEVTVNATFSRSNTTISNGNVWSKSDQFSWRPTSLNRSSIIRSRTYSRRQPRWFTPASAGWTPGHEKWSSYTDRWGLDGKLHSDSLWPTMGSSTNFWELLAAHASRTNLSSLLDADGLAATSQDVLTAYMTQILAELRQGIAANPSADTQTQRFVEGTLQTSHPRIAQNWLSTWALEALLVTILLSLLWIFYRFPSTALVPKPPDSIAARLSLLSGSSLTRELRDRVATNRQASMSWIEAASLGWWENVSTQEQYPSSSENDTADQPSEPPRWRYGIDIHVPGKNRVVMQKWNQRPGLSCTPFDLEAQEQLSSYGDGYRAAIDDNTRAGSSMVSIDPETQGTLDQTASIVPLLAEEPSVSRDEVDAITNLGHDIS